MPKQNIFMTSMYFFIPIHGLRKKCVKDFERNRKPINNSDFVKNTKIVCHYVDLNVSQTFYYAYGPQTNRITRPVTLNVSLLSYTPYHNKKARQFFIVVNATIDKTFSDEPRTLPNNPIDPTQICTEDDLVYLKYAFYKDRREGLFYPANDPTIFLHSWILEVINGLKLCRKELKSVNFDYSITDLKSAVIDINTESSTLQQVNTDFDTNYIQNPPPPISGWNNQDQICAALLSGNNNYERMPQEHIDAVVRNSFTNNISERTYIDKYNLVFYHWHHPFKDKTTCAKMPTLDNLQYIYELCTVVYARHRLRMIRYWANQNSISYIIKALTNQLAYLNESLFHLEAIDKTMTHIYGVMGVRLEMVTTKEICILTANKKNTSTSRRLNHIMAFLAAWTLFFTIIQILPDSMTPLSASCCQGCSHPAASSPSASISINLDSGVTQIAICVIAVLLILLVLWIIHTFILTRIKIWINRTTVKTIYEIEQED